MKAITIISPHYRGPRHRLENIALALSDKFKVNLFIFSSDVPKNSRRQVGSVTLSYIKLPLITRKLRLYYLLFVPIILSSALQADVIFTNEAYKTASIAGLICKILRKKLILFYGSLYFEELKMHSRRVSSIPKRAKTRLYETMELITAATVDAVISPDRRVTQHFQKHALRPRVINWFSTGIVNTDKFKPNSTIKKQYRDKLNIPVSDIVLLFIGELRKYSRDGAEIALHIFEKIKHHVSNTWLIMIGPSTSDFIDHLKKYISNKKISNIVFTGYIPHSVIQNYMLTADIAILANQEPASGIGNLPIELMSLGIPILTSNYSEIKQVVLNEQTGFVAENDDDFIQKGLKLVNQDSLRQTIGKNCREYALRNFSYKAFAEKFERLLKTLPS